jgi:SAM-dependent methyltransferase
MTNKLHDYTDVAENYDLYISGIMQSVHGLTENFLSFHLELAEKYGRNGILDLGCGTGALTIPIPLAERQFQIYALDISAAMLQVLKSKLAGSKLAAQIELIHAPMTHFSGPPLVGLALIARSGKLNRRERPVTLRWTFKAEIELLARLCGFTILEVYGGYDKSHPVIGGNLVWLLQKIKTVHYTNS